MKKNLLTLLAAIFAMVATAQGQAPAFPGAEGHGRYVTGGRGGVVRHVTTLEDDGTNKEGTFRWAVSGNSAKIVVFDVGGIIELKTNSDKTKSNPLKIGNNTTIAGQTAPSPGITIRYETVLPGANNIIRFIRFRRGEEKSVNESADAIWQRQVTGIILDHCSFSWSIDEVASFYDNNNFTMQWSTIAESLNNAGHGKGAHGYGGIWGGKLASFHHNMIAHVNNRAPRFNGARYQWTGYTSNKLYSQYKWANEVQAENVDFRNCVMYDWGSGSCYGGPGGGQINIVNNYYKAYAQQASKHDVITEVSLCYFTTAADNPKYWGMTSRYYINGNYNAHKEEANYDWKGVVYDPKRTNVQNSKNQCPPELVGVSYEIYEKDGEHYTEDVANSYGDDIPHETINGKSCVKIKMDAPCPIGEVTTHSAETAYKKVLEYAGASIYRDAVDARYAKEAQDGTATYKGSVTNKWGMIDKVSDQGTYELESTSRPEGFDTDKDGIPDAWETANGLNPNDANDAQLKTIDTTKNWYTNLEVYLNSLVEDIMKAGMADGESNYTEYWPEYKTTGISTIRTSAITATEYYDLSGRKLSEPQRGINIRIERMADGKNVTSKVIK